MGNFSLPWLAAAVVIQAAGARSWGCQAKWGGEWEYLEPQVPEALLAVH